MPKEYIVRLIFDHRHKSLLALRVSRLAGPQRARAMPATARHATACSPTAASSQGTTVIGGITYRVFDKQKVGEIAFCAVSASEQARPPVHTARRTSCTVPLPLRTARSPPIHSSAFSPWQLCLSRCAADRSTLFPVPHPSLLSSGEGLRHAADEQNEGICPRE